MWLPPSNVFKRILYQSEVHLVSSIAFQVDGFSKHTYICWTKYIFMLYCKIPFHILNKTSAMLRLGLGFKIQLFIWCQDLELILRPFINISWLYLKHKSQHNMNNNNIQIYIYILKKTCFCVLAGLPCKDMQKNIWRFPL